MYYLYIIQCADGSFYTGITTDLKRRIKEHNTSVLGAKYTRTRKPVRLVYIKEFPDRSESSKEEARIKKLSRTEKVELIKSARKEHVAKLRIKKKHTHREYLENKEQARELITAEVERMNLPYGFMYGKIAIRNQKTRWGSCSKKRNLNFNYKLIHVSKEEMEYVIVHELCHVAEFNHGKHFWELVARTIPEYKAIRSNMKKKGMDYV